jgi:hypothetical protein
VAMGADPLHKARLLDAQGPRCPKAAPGVDAEIRRRA